MDGFPTPPLPQERRPELDRPTTPRILAVVLATAATVLATLVLGPSAALSATGLISTVAGTGTAGFSGDGGPATAAQLNTPTAVDRTPDGGYVVTDQGGNRVRRVSASGVISTIAGGPGVLNVPNGLAVFPDGGVLIADSGAHRVRYVSPSGVVSTVAGTGVPGADGDGGPATAAQLSFPTGVAVQADGSYLIADNDNHRVRRVSGGTITTVAGTGVPGFSGDNGPATAAALNNPGDVEALPGGGFLVTEVEGNRVRRVDAGGSITTVLGTGTASSAGDGGPGPLAAVNNPVGVALLPDGGFAVAEIGGRRVRRVLPDGTATTLAGTGVAGSSGDGGPASAAQLTNPIGVASTAEGDVLIADFGAQRVRLVDAGDPVAVPGPGGGGPSTPLPTGPPDLVPRVVSAPGARLAGSTWINAGVTTTPSGVGIRNYEWDLNLDGRFETPCGSAPAVARQLTSASPGLVGVRLTDTLGRVSTAQVAVTPLQQAASRLPARVVTQLNSAYTCEDPGQDNQPDRADCVKTFGFGIVSVNSRGGPGDCFQITSRVVVTLAVLRQNATTSPLQERLPRAYHATIRGPVAVNGILVPLPEGATSEYDSGTLQMGLGRRDVRIGGYRVLSVDLNRRVPVKGRLELGSLRMPGGLPGLGGLPVGGEASLALTDKASEARLDVRLPSVFTFGDGRPATGRVVVTANNVDGLQIGSARIALPRVLLGPLEVLDLDLSYRREGVNEFWDGGAQLQLVARSPATLLARPLPDLPDGGFHLRNGAFAAAGAKLDLNPGLRPQIFPGVFLKSIKISVATNPTRFLGGAGVAVGNILDVDGSVLAVFATDSEPYEVPPLGGELAGISGRDLRSTTFAVGGAASVSVPVLGRVPLFGAYMLYSYPDYIEVGGAFDFRAGAMTVKGGVNGWIAFDSGRFNLEGTLEICYVVVCPRAQAVVSSRGIGVCAAVGVSIPLVGRVEVAATVGYRWGESFPGLALFSCDIGPYREINPRGFSSQEVGPHALEAATGGEMPLPEGLPSAMLRVTGTPGNAPVVSVTGPDGTTVTGSGETVSGTKDLIILRDRENGVTHVAIRAPKAGRWRVVSAGDTPVTSIAAAQGLDAARVQASLSGTGRRTLRYRISGLGPGRSVTFIERGPSTARILGTTRRPRGTVSFTPAPGRGGPRRVEALVEADGVATRSVSVARFRAARPVRAAAPRSVRVTRAGGRLRVRWGRVPGAGRYAVTVTPALGGRVFLVTTRTSVTLGVPAATGGTAVVSAVDPVSGPGRAARASFPAVRR